MSRNRCRTTSFVQRVAGLRKAKAEQSLADAMVHEKEKLREVEASTDRLLTTERALSGLATSHRIDISRAALYQVLLAAQDVKLTSDEEALQVRKKTRIAKASDLARTAHYHDEASRRAREALRERQTELDKRMAESLIESWVLRGVRRSVR